MKKKVRRPKDLIGGNVIISSDNRVYIQASSWDLETAKVLHAWLGRAIKYLEQQKGRK